MSDNENNTSEEAAALTLENLDLNKLERFNQGIRDNHNLSMGFAGGIIAAIVGASIWAGITYYVGYQIGFMAVGVGFMVGFAVQKMGQGIDPMFGIVGSICALFGCLAGNILTIYIMLAESEGLPVMDIIS